MWNYTLGALHGALGVSPTENVDSNVKTLSAPGNIEGAGLKEGLGLADESEPAEDSVHEGEREDSQQAALVSNGAGHERHRSP